MIIHTNSRVKFRKAKFSIYLKNLQRARGWQGGRTLGVTTVKIAENQQKIYNMGPTKSALDIGQLKVIEHDCAEILMKNGWRGCRWAKVP